MKNETKNYMGEVVFFNKQKYDHLIYLYENLEKSVTKVISAYNHLGIGAFTTDVFNDILNNGIANIKLKYEKAVHSEVKEFGVKTSAVSNLLDPSNEIIKNVSDLNRLIEEMKAEKEAQQEKFMFHDFILSYHVFEIEKGLSKINTEKIKRECQVVIDSDFKNEAYNLLLNFAEVGNKLRTLLDEHAKPGEEKYYILSDPSLNDEYFIGEEGGSGKIYINAAFLAIL